MIYNVKSHEPYVHVGNNLAEKLPNSDIFPMCAIDSIFKLMVLNIV